MQKPTFTPGRCLSIRWRKAEGLKQAQIEKLKLNPLTNGTSVELNAYLTFFDDRGASILVTRGSALGGDLEMFFPKGGQADWQAYFEPLNQIASGYAGMKHYTKVFPRDFV